MDLPRLFHDLVFDYTLRTVALGSGTLGVVSGVLGSYAVLRRQSLVGDVMSHSALPGIALAFLVVGTKDPLALLLGAAIAAWAGALFIRTVVGTTRVKDDSAMGLVLSVFFGLGLVLLTFIQRMPQAAHAGLEKFLFGQAAALMERDVAVMAVMGALTLGTIAFLWKEFKLLSFDPEFAASLGYPVRRLDMIMTTLLVIAIALGLQTVGVVLMSAMIVAPASAARQWTDRLGVMIVLSAGFGALAGIAGAVVSSATAHLPTGPTIVLCASAIAGCSLALSPNRGLFWRWLAQLRNRRRLRVELVLERLYALALQHDDPHHPHPAVVLRARDFAEAATSSTRRRMDLADAGIIRTLRELESRRWVRRVGIDDWGLTPEGLNQARQIMRGPESGAS